MGHDLLRSWELLAGGEDKRWIWKAMRTQRGGMTHGDEMTAVHTQLPEPSPLNPPPHTSMGFITSLPFPDACGAPSVHDAGGRGAEDDGHAEEADPTDHPGQHRLWEQLGELRAGWVHLHPCIGWEMGWVSTPRHRSGDGKSSGAPLGAQEKTKAAGWEENLSPWECKDSSCAHCTQSPC